MDNRGVLGFPMRLGLAFTLIALCVPVLSEMTEGFRDSTDENELNSEISKIIAECDRLYYGGSGSVSTVEIKTVPGYEIVIGGENADAYSVRIFKGDSEVSQTYLEHPSVRFHGDEKRYSGNTELLLKCETVNGNYGITVEQI